MRTVADLAGKAVESALGFRVSGFKSKAFIDIKSIKTATTNAIRAICKQRGYSGEVPLVNTVEIVGNAAFSAVEKWNKVADPKNHVDRDWLRNCVSNLVGGAVTHAAFEDNRWLNDELFEREEEEEEYLDPAGDDYENMSDYTNSTVIYKPAAAAPSNEDDGYYGLQQTHTMEENNVLDNSAALLPRHQSDLRWAALNNGQAEPHVWATVNDATAIPERTYCLDTPSRKRTAPPTDSEDNDESVAQITQPKRRRNVEQTPTSASAKAGLDDEDGEETVVDEAPSQRQVSSRLPWTLAEADRLVTTRESGKSWDEVQVSFSHRTKAALMNKYRTIKDVEKSVVQAAADEDENGGHSMSQVKRRGDRGASGQAFRV
ncbi:hypothetical protein N0V82_003700 [Gnomoniopsis sp. IMI 355080]|nr:hypothetical protein N0V82_003700 [Gnomoniopsis sp. IMI 355080]